MNQPDTIPAPFDAVADIYDADFTRTPLGRHQRGIVHRRLEHIVRPGMRVLELNCGTGEDAVWMAQQGATVAATDISEGMLRVAAGKIGRAGLEHAVRLHRMGIEELRNPTLVEKLGKFDLIFSNFDGINCLPDVRDLPGMLAPFLAPNGHVVLVFMNPVCAVEIAGNVLRGRLRAAFQRLRSRGVTAHIGDGATVHTWFHPVHTVRAAFREGYRLHRIEAVGLLTPPTLMRDFFHRHERSFQRLYGLEKFLSPLPPFNRLGDHVLIHVQATR